MITVAEQVVHELLAFYLVITFAATGLAKACNWREASAVVASERLIPHRLAAAGIVVVILAELLLATLVAIRFMPLIVGGIATAMFLTFGGYKLIAGLKRGTLGCACAGSQTVYKATVPGMIATCLASLLQATIAAIYALTPAASDSLLLNALLLSALVAPVLMLFYRVIGSPSRRYEGETMKFTHVHDRSVPHDHFVKQ